MVSREQREVRVLSPSNDLRFLGPDAAPTGAHQGLPSARNLVGVVGISVGFGSNFMNAIYAEKRLILNNGSHRAYALRRWASRSALHRPARVVAR